MGFVPTAAETEDGIVVFFSFLFASLVSIVELCELNHTVRSCDSLFIM